MNKKEISGIARAFIGVILAFASAKGWVAGIDLEGQAAIATSVAALIAVWSVKSKRST